MFRVQISSESMWHEIHENYADAGGVYILRCGNELPIPIERLLGTDDGGVLYIGKASSFITRIADLKKSISPHYNSGPHECGVRYKSHENISKKFPYEQLYLELISSDAPRNLEIDLLKDYEAKYGELPPLNRVS